MAQKGLFLPMMMMEKEKKKREEEMEEKKEKKIHIHKTGSFTPKPYALDKWLYGTQNWSGHCEEENKSL
jgi:hypothetical protein